MIILKVTKNQGLTISLANVVLEKPHGVGQSNPQHFQG